MSSADAFKKFWDLGYETLIPIIPPDAPISAISSLAKRVGTHQDGRGKVPGIKGRDGNWFSFDWVPYQTDETDLERWQSLGAGTGIRTGVSLIAIDADATNEDHARIIRDCVAQHLGTDLPIRVGRYPKALYLCRVSAPYQYTRIEFGPRDHKGNCDRVEVLSDGRQFIAEGIHPKTGKPYTWPKPIVPFAELPVFSPEQIDGLLLDLTSKLPQAEAKLIKEGATTEINQAALAGDLETVRRAVQATPNTTALFPSRESYRDYGYAIKAALPEHPDEAFEIYADWCDKWVDEHGRSNDPNVTKADWDRMKPPFRVGASYIYEKAEATSAGAFTRADAWFDPVVLDHSIFDVAAQTEKDHVAGDVYPLLRISDLMSRQPPVFLIENYIPQNALGFLVAPPGVAKTFAALDMALSIAHGLDAWQGNAIKPSGDGSVLYIASEGSFDMPLRIGAWLSARGIGRVSDKFVLLEASVNFMDTASVDKLLRSIAGVVIDPALVVVDTVSRALPGADENLQKDMSLFVTACERVQRAHNCVVMGLHHTSKAGDIRGSSVLLGAADFAITMERKKGDSHGKLTMAKLKAARDGWSKTFHLTEQDVGLNFLPKAFLDIKPVWGSLVFDILDETAGGAVGDGSPVGPDLAALVLRAIERDWNAGAPWSMAPQSKERYAPRKAWKEFELGASDAESLLKAWLGAGLLEIRDAGTRSKTKGLFVVRYDAGGDADVSVFG